MSELIKLSTGPGLAQALFGKKKTKKPTPRVMPDIEDEAIQMARKRSIARQRRRTGRASTILSDGTRSSGSGFGG